MKTSTRPLLLISLTLLFCLFAANVTAQLSAGDIDDLKSRSATEGWTFEVAENPATEIPLDQLAGTRAPDNWKELAPWSPMRGSSLSLPVSFDWRDSSGVTPIKNQGSCGSCWAFATVGTFECVIKIRDGVEVDLSEQYLNSCNRDGWGCAGGWYAHDYHINKSGQCGDVGAVYESDYPYQAADLSCACGAEHNYTMSSWSYIGDRQSTPSVQAMKEAILAYGPITVCVTANYAMQAYNGGVFNAHDGSAINHAVVLVGWDDTQGSNGVWIMRNSWGSWWGESGYMRIEYGTSNIGYAAAFIEYRPIDIQPTQIFGPAPQTATFAMDAPWTTPTACTWNFGDGVTSGEVSPSHTYGPGYHNVSVTMDCAEGEFSKTVPGLAAVYADTIKPLDVILSGETSIRVDFYARNYLPLQKMTIPITWGEQFNLTYDSISTAGLRTDYFEQQNLLNFDPARQRMTVYLANTQSSGLPDLPQGDGPVLSVWYSVPSWISSGSNPISVTSYLAYEPSFVTSPGSYQPVTGEGVVGFPLQSCCVGNTGNVDGDPDEIIDVGDLTALIGYMFMGIDISCVDEANTDGIGSTDIGDMTRMINFLFLGGAPPVPCP